MNTGQQNQRQRQQGSCLIAVVGACWLLFLTTLPLSARAAADAVENTSPVEMSINGTNSPSTGYESQQTAAPALHQHDLEPIATTPAKASAQDLSLFGILALGIIGLLWVRRHTSEL